MRANDPLLTDLANADRGGAGDVDETSEAPLSGKAHIGIGPTNRPIGQDDDESHRDRKLAHDRGNGVAVDTGSGTAPVQPSPGVKRQTIIDICDFNGKVRLPDYLGDGLYILSLGSRVPLLPAFHSKRALFVPGYRAIRQDGQDSFYLCEVCESADGKSPVFRVCLLHDMENVGTAMISWGSEELVAVGRDPSHVWLSATNQGDSSVRLVSGAERFGLYEPTVIYHMQRLSGADRAEGFVFRDFSMEGAGADVVGSPGIHSAFHSALQSELGKRGIADLADSWRLAPTDMEIPAPWIELYGGRKKRRKSGSYWG
jgi:hypothetical protein